MTSGISLFKYPGKSLKNTHTAQCYWLIQCQSKWNSLNFGWIWLELILLFIFFLNCTLCTYYVACWFSLKYHFFFSLSQVSTLIYDEIKNTAPYWNLLQNPANGYVPNYMSFPFSVDVIWVESSITIIHMQELASDPSISCQSVCHCSLQCNGYFFSHQKMRPFFIYIFFFSFHTNRDDTRRTNRVSCFVHAAHIWTASACTTFLFHFFLHWNKRLLFVFTILHAMCPFPYVRMRW